MRSRALPSCRPGAPSPDGGAAALAPVAIDDQKATPWRSGRAAFGTRRRQLFGDAARRGRGMHRVHGQSKQCGRAACRSWRRDPSSPARNRRRAPRATSCAAAARMLGLGRRQRRLQGEEPRHHALDIAVDRDRRPVEGDRRDGRRGVGADARQLPQAPPRVSGNRPPWLRDDRTRAGDAGCARGRSSRAPARHAAPRRARPRRALRPSGQRARKRVEIGPDRRDRGLLQHDLAEPDAIGIGALARPRAPGQARGDGGRTRREDRAASVAAASLAPLSARLIFATIARHERNSPRRPL